MAHHDLVVHPLVLRETRVERVYDVTPRMRRVTVVGEQLKAFSRGGFDFPAFASPAFDDHVKIILASKGDIRAALPIQLENGIEWTPSDTREARDYTPRRFDTERGELDLDFVRHGDGPAATWAEGVQPGDSLWFAGPKSSTLLPADLDWVLMAGDETALPAIGRFFEERPTDAPVRAIIVITDSGARQELALRPSDEVRWILADSADPEVFASAVADVEPLPGTGYVWAAGESRALLPLRRLASRTLNVTKSHTNITGYWNHREVTADGPSHATDVRSLAPSPLAWFAVRAALQIGLIDAVADADGGITFAECARRTGTDPARLNILLRSLLAAHILKQDPEGGVSLSVAGEELVADEHLREHYDGFHADQMLALNALPAAMTRQVSPWAATQGRTIREGAEVDPGLYEEFIEEAEGLPHLLTGLPHHRIWTQAERVGVTGPGALAVAEVMREHGNLTLMESELPLAALRDADESSAHEFAESWAPQDVVVTAFALGHRTDAEIDAFLCDLRGVTGKALLIERLAPDALNPLAISQAALVHLAMVGAPPVDSERLAGFLARAGWTVASQGKLGWGVECVEIAAVDRA